MNVKTTKKKNQVVTAKKFEQQELLKKAKMIKENLTASTWRELETNGKFDKNEKLYGELRRLSMFRDQLNEDRIRSINRMHREMKIYFPEYKDALGKVDGAFSLELLKHAPFPDDLISLGEDGIRQIRHDSKLRVRGYSFHSKQKMHHKDMFFACEILY